MTSPPLSRRKRFVSRKFGGLGVLMLTEIARHVAWTHFSNFFALRSCRCKQCVVQSRGRPIIASCSSTGKLAIVVRLLPTNFRRPRNERKIPFRRHEIVRHLSVFEANNGLRYPPGEAHSVTTTDEASNQRTIPTRFRQEKNDYGGSSAAIQVLITTAPKNTSIHSAGWVGFQRSAYGDESVR